MNNLKAFNLNFGAVVVRFYLMIAVVLIAGFTGYWLIGFLALPIFLSSIMGIDFSSNKKIENKHSAPTYNMRTSPTRKLQDVA